MLKHKIYKLKDDILNNKENLAKHISTIEIFLSELNWIISSDMSHSLMFQWWVNNEQTIENIYNQLDKNATPNN